MSSRPNFDPNNYGNYSQEELSRNLPIWASYEPGSTQKIVTTAAAVEEGVVDLFKDEFTDTGSVQVDTARIKCWKAGGHGHQTFLQVLQNSCNPGFVKMGQLLGKERLFHYLDLFGFGNKTGIEIPKSKSITSNNEPTLIMNGILTSDATDNVIYLANDPNDNTTKFVIENTDNTENKILASGNKVVVTDVNNNILYTSNERTRQIDVEDYEENHPETEENNTIEENNKVENPHTGDSIFGYVATGIIAVMGIAILTKKNNK